MRPSSSYVMGARGESCSTTCRRRGQVCNANIPTGDSTALFASLNVSCIADSRCGPRDDWLTAVSLLLIVTVICVIASQHTGRAAADWLTAVSLLLIVTVICAIASQRTLNQLRLQQYTTPAVYVSSKCFVCWRKCFGESRTHWRAHGCVLCVTSARGGRMISQRTSATQPTPTTADALGGMRSACSAATALDSCLSTTLLLCRCCCFVGTGATLRPRCSATPSTSP